MALKVSVLFFASARDAVGSGALDVEVSEGATVATLLQRLVADYPKLALYAPHLMVAVNTEYAGRDSPLHAGDEVAFIPPVSGGGDV